LRYFTRIGGISIFWPFLRCLPCRPPPPRCWYTILTEKRHTNLESGRESNPGRIISIPCHTYSAIHDDKFLSFYFESLESNLRFCDGCERVVPDGNDLLNPLHDFPGQELAPVRLAVDHHVRHDDGAMGNGLETQHFSHWYLVNDRQSCRPNIWPNNGLPNIRQPNIR
jgi:hypothetical protein